MNGVIQPKLSTKHAKWIIDWALEECVEQIKRCEIDIARHKANDSTPSHTTLGLKEREAVIEDKRRALREYHDCYLFLMGAKEMVMNKSAEEFANDMAAMFAERRAKK